jgi:hypothetical protein
LTSRGATISSGIGFRTGFGGGVIGGGGGGISSGMSSAKSTRGSEAPQTDPSVSTEANTNPCRPHEAATGIARLNGTVALESTPTILLVDPDADVPRRTREV